MIKYFLCYIAFFIVHHSVAQRAGNTAASQNINSDKYFRIHFENDLFFKTDYYYTQGTNIELVHPTLRKNPLTRLLVKPKKSSIKYGLAFKHFAFTPVKLRKEGIVQGDRPFSASMFFNTFSIASNPDNRSRVSAALSTGIIGRFAMAKKLQGVIHEWTSSDAPQGWKHQIQNDVILNYELSHEKEFFAFKNFLYLNSLAQVKFGTFQNKIRAGVNLTLGKYNSPFQINDSKDNFQAYLYAQPSINGVAYDASLQGGFFNESPYTLERDVIERVTWQGKVGAVMTYRKWYMEFNSTYLSKEFKGGKSHKWGGIILGLSY